jgi:hypothetical protein
MVLKSVPAGDSFLCYQAGVGRNPVQDPQIKGVFYFIQIGRIDKEFHNGLLPKVLS